MTSIALPDDTVKSAPKLEAMEQVSLQEWLPADEQNIKNEMESYGYWRNVHRVAQSYGPNMISMLMDAGVLVPEQDPLEALRELLKEKGF